MTKREIRRRPVSAAEAVEALREFIAAADQSVAAVDDVAAMLRRYGQADEKARALIARFDGGGGG